MQLTAGAVAYELPHHTETSRLTVALHSMADISNAVARHCLGNAQMQCLFGDLQQAADFQVHLAHRIGAGIVSVEPIHFCTGIDADDIARAGSIWS